MMVSDFYLKMSYYPLRELGSLAESPAGYDMYGSFAPEQFW